MKDIKLKLGLVSFFVLLAIAIGGFYFPTPAGEESFGGSIYNRFISFDAGIGVKGTEFIDEDGNIEISGTTTLGDSGDDTVTVTGKVTGDIYWNDSGTSTGTIKAHDHLTTSGYNVQLRSESIATSGTHWGIDSETHLNANGTTSIRGVQGVAKLSSGFTGTGSSLVGTYGQARADGTLAGAAQMAGLYGLIEASSAVTATLVTSAWLDSHQANTVTGSHQLLRMTNNGAATMDEAIYIYGGNKITNLMTLNTVSGMVAGPSTAANGTPVKIQIDVDGTSYYINAYPTSNN